MPIGDQQTKNIYYLQISEKLTPIPMNCTIFCVIKCHGT